ncbi:MAG: hypothetical protein KJZ47_08300 [Gemmatimonadales bacterium]|nr:hypothetical protein [Gemmatimonadales bacterium]
MGDIGPFALLALVWWVFSILGEAKKRQQKGKGRPPVQRPSSPRAEVPTRRPAAGDPSQREGSRLEQILREMERALDPMSQLPPPEPEPEQRGSWDTGMAEVEEVEALTDYRPEVASREDLSNFERPEREVIILGGDQEELQRRRMKYADVRSKALTKADHDRFDARIRQPQVVAAVAESPPPTARMARLRQAIIWREVLGPPVAMRGEERF